LLRLSWAKALTKTSSTSPKLKLLPRLPLPHLFEQKRTSPRKQRDAFLCLTYAWCDWTWGTTGRERYGRVPGWVKAAVREKCQGFEKGAGRPKSTDPFVFFRSQHMYIRCCPLSANSTRASRTGELSSSPKLSASPKSAKRAWEAGTRQATQLGRHSPSAAC
jgi:hypothetical protein